MLRVLSLALSFVERALEYLCAVLFVIIVAVVFVNVVGRYLLNAPLRGSDEIAQYLFLWLAYLGAVVALSKGRHYSVANLADLLPGRARIAAALTADLIVLAMLGVLIRYGYRLVDILAFGSSPALGLPIYYVYAALLVAAILMALVVLAQIPSRFSSTATAHNDDGHGGALS